MVGGSGNCVWMFGRWGEDTNKHACEDEVDVLGSNKTTLDKVAVEREMNSREGVGEQKAGNDGDG